MKPRELPPAVKFDVGKTQWSLAPWDALRAVVDVLVYGARKYADRNWERGTLYSRYYDAAIRHLTAWWQEGEENDPESGLSHLAHAACCVLFLLAWRLRGLGGKNDNRPARTVRYRKHRGRSVTRVAGGRP